jgi:hypothetical protein
MTSRSIPRDHDFRGEEDVGAMAAPQLPPGRIYTLRIWWLAVGYCAFYAPYAALARAASSGLLPGVDVPASGLQMLPAVGVAIAIVSTLIVTALGWWRYCGRRTIMGVTVPWPSRCTLLAGCATAAIIYTTTLMYTFKGVSIVLALLLMRGGVLVLAPIVDTVFARRVRWFSWIALALSLWALVMAAAAVPSYDLGWTLMLTVGTYLGGYATRLRCANTTAKRPDRDATYRYFVEEQLVAMVVLVALPIALALAGCVPMQRGVTSFLATNALWLPLLIGTLYAGLYVFGTLIYLDRRENSFCVPLNRCSSLLAGLIATYGLSLFFDQRSLSTHELMGAGLVLAAIGFLSPLHHIPERLSIFSKRVDHARWPQQPLPAPAANHAADGFTLGRANAALSTAAGLPAPNPMYAATVESTTSERQA